MSGFFNYPGEEMGFKAGVKLKYMALGQGMGPKAAEVIESGASRGLWVMLQNCHLLPKWLKTLEKILDKLEKPHKVTRTSSSYPVAMTSCWGPVVAQSLAS